MEERAYQRLIVWKEAHQLCLKIYACTKVFPTDEKFGLVSQMRRAAYSVPMNITEGNARRGHKERIHFLDISGASLEELHYQTFLALDLKYLSPESASDIDNRIQRVGYLLMKLRSSLS